DIGGSWCGRDVAPRGGWVRRGPGVSRRGRGCEEWRQTCRDRGEAVGRAPTRPSGRGSVPPEVGRPLRTGTPRVSMDHPAGTVFIAEDNPILLQGLGRALSANGYAVETAESGPAVLDLLSSTETPPDLLLLDVMMPGMSGMEVLRALHAHPRWSALP